MKASIIIPTKNGGALFGEVLAAIFAQQTPWPFEVLVVDSGSTDETLAICARFPAVRVHCIPAREFGHGRTRNLAISLTSGEFIAVITQDAKPAGPQWLATLVAAVEQAPDIAGAFGRHLPYPGRDPFLARDLALHFDNFAKGPAVVRLDDPARYAADQGYRQWLHYFSDNNACLRRAVWERIPYPEVDFAEDQLWAKSVIEAGYAKAYADGAAVFHSHEYPVVACLKRSYDESRAFRRSFGYRLCPSFAHGAAQTARCALRDYRYLFRERLGRRYPEWLLKLPFYHLARQAGHFLGARSGDSRMLDFVLSLDQARKRQ